MKITKKQPLRPRGRSEDKRQSTKNIIRDAYINGPQKEVQIIPAKRDMEAETEKKKLRVCAYCRVSTDEDTQASSYELQVQNYKAVFHELGNRLFEQALDVVHAADVRHLQQLSDLFPAGIFFRCAFLSCHNKTSTVVLLLYTTLEVYTKYGMVSGFEDFIPDRRFISPCCGRGL